MFGSALRAEDFSRLLKQRPLARSAHFAIHHEPLPLRRAQAERGTAVPEDLSTCRSRGCQQPVDEQSDLQALGLIFPKRLAPRAATRNLLRRQARAQFSRAAPGLPAGRWLVRQREAFDKLEFPSAASRPLAHAARLELQDLLERAQRCGA